MWYKSDFAKLTNEEIETLRAKVLKLPTLSMEIFDNYTNVSNFLVWYKSDFAKLTNEEIETLRAKVLKLPTMSMEIFDNILENIDDNYPFSLSPKLILALLVSVGICVIAIGIIFIWYKRKASLTSSTVGNLVKLVPSLKEKVPRLNSVPHIIRTNIFPK